MCIALGVIPFYSVSIFYGWYIIKSNADHAFLETSTATQNVNVTSTRNQNTELNFGYCLL